MGGWSKETKPSITNQRDRNKRLRRWNSLETRTVKWCQIEPLLMDWYHRDGPTLRAVRRPIPEQTPREQTARWSRDKGATPERKKPKLRF